MGYLTGKVYAGIPCVFWHTEEGVIYILNIKTGELMGVIK